MAKRLNKRDKEEINRMAAIIRNSRYPNGYISPHVAATLLYESGYRKPEKSVPTSGLKDV